MSLCVTRVTRFPGFATREKLAYFKKPKSVTREMAETQFADREVAKVLRKYLTNLRY